MPCFTCPRAEPFALLVEVSGLRADFALGVLLDAQGRRSRRFRRSWLGAPPFSETETLSSEPGAAGARGPSPSIEDDDAEPRSFVRVRHVAIQPEGGGAA